MDTNEALKCIMELCPQLDDQQVESVKSILAHLEYDAVVRYKMSKEFSEDAWICAREMGWIKEEK